MTKQAESFKGNSKGVQRAEKSGLGANMITTVSKDDRQTVE